MSFNLFGGSDNSNKKTKTVQKTKLGTTTTTNPYVTSSTNNKGTTSNFIEGSAFDTINNFVNANMGSLLYNYLNPSLDSPTNQSLLNSYVSSLTNNAKTTFENNVVNPLSQRNMIRSSQATNVYNNFSNNLSNQISGYVNQLLSQSQQNSADVLKNMLSAYTQGMSAVNTNQAQSLQTSIANATRTTTGSTTSGSSNDWAETAMKIIPIILMAMMA